MPAQQQRQHGHHGQQPQLRVDDEPHRQRDEHQQRPDVDQVLAGQHHRGGLHPGGQLQVRHDRTGEGHRADEDADDHLGGVDAEHALGRHLDGVRADGMGLDVQVAVPADQHRGQTHEQMQQRDELRHAGHLDDLGLPQPDGCTDGHRAEQQCQAQRLQFILDGQRDGGDQRDGHADDAEADAGAGGLVFGQPGQRQDEEQRRDDVGRGGGVFQGEHGCGVPIG